MFSSAMVVWLKSVKSEIREQVLGLVRKGKGRQTKRKEIGEDASAATGRLIDRRARFRFRSNATKSISIKSNESATDVCIARERQRTRFLLRKAEVFNHRRTSMECPILFLSFSTATRRYELPHIQRHDEAFRRRYPSCRFRCFGIQLADPLHSPIARNQERRCQWKQPQCQHHEDGE
jgi:hypothetical protein